MRNRMALLWVKQKVSQTWIAQSKTAVKVTYNTNVVIFMSFFGQIQSC